MTPSLADYIARIQHPAQHQRRGQYAFNLLADLRPDLSEQVRATDLDPFYKDHLPHEFVEWVKANWNVKGHA